MAQNSDKDIPYLNGAQWDEITQIASRIAANHSFSKDPHSAKGNPGSRRAIWTQVQEQLPDHLSGLFRDDQKPKISKAFFGVGEYGRGAGHERQKHVNACASNAFYAVGFMNNDKLRDFLVRQAKDEYFSVLTDTSFDVGLRKRKSSAGERAYERLEKMLAKDYADVWKIFEQKNAKIHMGQMLQDFFNPAEQHRYDNTGADGRMKVADLPPEQISYAGLTRDAADVAAENGPGAGQRYHHRGGPSKRSGRAYRVGPTDDGTEPS